MYTPDKLPEKLKNELAKDSHGITFPAKSGCQMRFVRDKKNYGTYYSYKQWGSPEKAIRAAMNRQKQLRALYPTSIIRRERLKSGKISCGVNGVGYREKLDKRRGKIERFYWVSYHHNGKPAIKTFSLGYKEFTASQQLHAYRTAIQFRADYDHNGQDIDHGKYKEWRNIRVYVDGFPSVTQPG